MVYYDNNLNGTTYGLRNRVEPTCHITLDQRDNFEQSAVFFDKNMFNKMDRECNIIEITGNNFFGPHILGNFFAGK